MHRQQLESHLPQECRLLPTLHQRQEHRPVPPLHRLLINRHPQTLHQLQEHGHPPTNLLATQPLSNTEPPSATNGHLQEKIPKQLVLPRRRMESPQRMFQLPPTVLSYPDLVCSSNPRHRLTRRCPAADEAKDQDSGGNNDEPIDPSLSSTYGLIGTRDKARSALQDAIDNDSPDVVAESLSGRYVRDSDVAKTAAILKQDDANIRVVSAKPADSLNDPNVNISPTTQFVRTRIRSKNDGNPRDRWDKIAFWRGGAPTARDL